VRPGAKTLIIGPGGGWDVARALASGSHDITGVEINPIIATTIMRQRFPELSRGLYLRPDVHIFVEDGRSFVRRSTDKYQVLQATLVDTWAATAAGAFALSENNLYTTDAFRDYLAHLTGDGMVAVTRWGLEPPRESLRLVSLAMEALRQLGEADAWRHFISAAKARRRAGARATRC
jgi:spermidine synthase